MDTHDIALLRLAAQGIAAQPPGAAKLSADAAASDADVSRLATNAVRHMAAMQAQDYYASLWAVGVRSGLMERQVIEVLEARRVIRTWPQRGTLHLVVAEDATWMSARSAPRLLAGARRRRENLGLDDATLARAGELFGAALQGGALLSRPAMMALLEADDISTAGGRGYHILWYAAQTGLIYVGPMDKKQQTFGLVADLPMAQRQLSGEAALAELTARYFESHGPATLQDLMWWAGLTAAEAKAGLQAVSTKPISTTVAGKDYWHSADAAGLSSAVSRLPPALLLPAFDEFILGYKDRRPQLEPAYASRIVPGGNGMFMPPVVVGGRVVGMWKRSLKKQLVAVDITLFEPVTATARKDIAKAADVYGGFLGLGVKLSWL